ncbi:MAG: nickel-binding protein [Gaiellaceae bacterium]
MDRTSYFALELARPAEGWQHLDELILRARNAGDAQPVGNRVRFVRSVFIPEDETCLCVYQASSVEDVREAARRAQLPSERVVEAITESKGKG